MTAISLLVQSALLVLVAYFLGAWLGCVLRRLASRGSTETVAAAAATPSPVAANEPARHFDTALAGQTGQTVTPPSPEPAPTFEPVAPTIETIPERASPEPAARVDTTPAEVAAPVEDVPKRDDVTLIRGVDDAARETLAAAGIRSFAQLGALGSEDVRKLDEALGSRGRIARENWIEQAQMLAADRPTAYAVIRGGQAGIALATPSPDQGTPLSIEQVPESQQPPTTPVSDAGEATHAAGIAAATAASEAAALASQPAETSPATSTSGSVSPQRETSSVASDENFQRIAGITPEIDELLKSRGIRRYSQIAGWTDNDVQRIEALLGVSGRVANENWIGQARELAGLSVPGTPANDDEATPDLLSAAGIAPASDLTGLRSVKSPAFTAGQTGQSTPAGPPADLKRIRGIGVMIEKRLHMLGVHSYEQIANWTRGDIDRVSRELEFKGRIERENWVEQARILVAGGQTNFSRRFDSRSSSN